MCAEHTDSVEELKKQSTFIIAVQLDLLKEDYEPNQDLILSSLVVLLYEVMDAIRVTHHNRKVHSVSVLRSTVVF